MARKNKTEIPKAYEAIFSKESSSTRREYENAAANFESMMSETQKKISESKLDDKIKQMLNVQMKYVSSTKTSKQIEKFIDEYSKDAKLGKRQLKYLESMKTEISKLRESDEKQFRAQLKYKGVSLGDAREAYSRGGIKGALSYGKAAAKSISMKDMLKAGVHGAGVLADIPALNLLAASFDPKKDEKSYEASIEIQNILKNNQESFAEEKSTRDTTAKQTAKIADSSGEIVGQLRTANSTLSEMLFRQKDMGDDVKASAKSTADLSEVTVKKTEKAEKEGSDFGMFDDLFDKRKRGRLKGKAGKLGRMLKVGAKAAMPFLSKAGPIAAVAGLGYGGYQGVSEAAKIHGVKEASLMQKITAGIGGAANMLSFGMLDTGKVARTLQSGSDYFTGTNPKTAEAKYASSPAEVKQAIANASKQTGVNPELMKRMAYIESGFNTNAQAGTSSAGGLYQFVDSTWKMMLKQHGAKYGLGMDASRFDPRANALMGAEYVKGNIAELSKVKSVKDINATDIYSAHFMGSSGAKKLIGATQSNPNAVAAEMFPKEARANPSIFYDSKGNARTVSQLYGVLNKKVGDIQATMPADTISVAANVPPPSKKPVVTATTQSLNTQTERAMTKKTAQLPGKSSLIDYDELAKAVRSGVNGAVVNVQTPPTKKMNQMSLEDSHSAEVMRLRGT